MKQSPFPGMDPYLESDLWCDLQFSLAVAISIKLAEVMDERYVARLEPGAANAEDFGVPVTPSYLELAEIAIAEQQPGLVPPRLVIPVPARRFVRTDALHIRSKDGTLVTSIEILSPANKFGESREKFRSKWRRLHAQGVHLVEIDLIRRGQRIFSSPELDAAPYVVTVTRGDSGTTGAWPFSLREPIPAFPVPLLSPDPDCPIELQPMLQTVYRQGRYSNTIDYSQDPPAPRFSVEDLTWIREQIASAAVAD